MMAFSGFAFVCSYLYWFGGHSIGYRHVLTSAVLLAMLPAFCFDALHKSRTAMAVFGIAFILSIAFSMVALKIMHDPILMDATWLEERGVEFGDFFTDLMPRCLVETGRC